MRLLVLLLLILSISFESMAGTPANALQNISRYYKTPLRRAGPSLYKAGSALAKSTAESAGHHSQALILIMLLTGVDIVRQNLQLASLRKENIDQKLILEHSAQAAEHILKSGHIWSSIFGASITTTAMAKPLAVVQTLIQNSKSYPILKDLLSNGIATLVLFVGWELGGQLFLEAREMLEDESDYQRAEELMPVLLNAFKYGAGQSNDLNKADWALLQKLYQNIVEILISNHDLRNLWLYNAFRLRIATGELAVLVTSMVGASAVGTALFPGAGTLAGMGFGLIGGVVSLYIPQDQKDWISEKIKDFRILFGKSGRDGYGNPLMSYHETVFRIISQKIKANEPLPPMLTFKSNPHSMNGIMTAAFEKAYMYDSRLQSALAMRAEAIKFKNQKSVDEWTDVAKKERIKYLDLADELTNAYRTDLEHFENLLVEFDLADKMNDVNMIQKYPILKKIQKQHQTLKTMNSFFGGTLVPAIRAGMLKDVSQKTYFKAMQKFYLLGFDETEVLRLYNM